MNNTVRLIGSDGKQLGIMQYILAKKEAESEGLDLVEVSKKANPPVYKIMDRGKMKYEAAKAAKANMKKGPQTKDIKFKVGIQDNDFLIKLNKIIEFLEKGHKVNVSVSLKGRQRQHTALGAEIIERTVQTITNKFDLVDTPVSAQGSVISTTLTKK